MSNTKQQLLAGKLKKVRKELGYSQREMGKALKLSDKAVSSYEVGRATPSLETLQEIGRITHRPAGYFLDDDGYKDLDLQLKLNRIERELLEVKKLLKKRG